MQNEINVYDLMTKVVKDTPAKMRAFAIEQHSQTELRFKLSRDYRDQPAYIVKIFSYGDRLLIRIADGRGNEVAKQIFFYGPEFRESIVIDSISAVITP